MTVFILKIIAYVLMIIDHLTYAYIPQVTAENIANPLYIAGRALGRPAFLIFAFLVVESYYHTRNKIKYLRNLAIMALISEIPFDILTNGTNVLMYMRMQNVCWTLLVGFLAVWIVDIVRTAYFGSQMGKYYFISSLTITLAYAAAYLGRSDYGGLGVLAVLIFYFFFRQETQLAVALFVWGAISAFMDNSLEVVGVVVMIGLLHFYKGEKGYSSKSAKVVFYAIYPVHMLIIGVMARYGSVSEFINWIPIMVKSFFMM